MRRGDIYSIDLNPTLGHEESGRRFVLIISPAAFNVSNLPFVAPITGGGDFARNRGFAVSLTGTGCRTDGVVLANQIRALDLKARGGRFVEKAPKMITEQVIDAVTSILEAE